MEESVQNGNSKRLIYIKKYMHDYTITRIMFFLRRPGSAKYEKSAVKFISLFGKITKILLQNENENDISKLFELIDIPDDMYDVFVGIVVALNIENSPGLLTMKGVSSVISGKTQPETVVILKSLRNSELNSIIEHSNRALEFISEKMSLVNENIVMEPMIMFLNFIQYISIIRKIKFGSTKAQPLLTSNLIKKYGVQSDISLFM